MFRADLSRDYARGLNELSREREALVARGEPFIDLTSGSPGGPRAGFFTGETLRALQEAALAGAAEYRPDPLGRPDARAAISARYTREGIAISPDRIVITPGTSLSYLYAFSILVQPGEEVLCPCPSYPLFGEIARVTGASLVPYRLDEPSGWRVDLDHLESQISTKTRAVVVISPHNPTGAVATAQELNGLADIARRHDLAVIADEVFDEFLFGPEPFARAASSGAPLVFTLNGFSKMFALPGWKLGWIAVSGEEERVQRAVWMLAHVSDAFLPVNEGVQCTVPEILRSGAPVTSRIRAQAARGRALALERLDLPGLVEIHPPEGGFFLTARLSAGQLDEEALAVELLREDRVLVYPGYFYDLPPSHLVLAYVEEEAALGRALDAIAHRIAARARGRLPA